MKKLDFATYLTICEEDAHWIPQYLAGMERMDLPFGVYFDRCSGDTKRRLTDHPLCLASVSQDDPAIEYDEMAKQNAFDALLKHRPRWIIYTDSDELWERDAPAKFSELLKMKCDYARGFWVNCWDDLEHVRVDTIFCGAKRVKFYNVQDNRRWRFDHKITNGAKLIGGDGLPTPYAKKGETDIVCLHTGLMTHELRVQHKARWDRIYTAAVGANPYGFWNYCLDYETYPPKIEPNPYL